MGCVEIDYCVIQWSSECDIGLLENVMGLRTNCSFVVVILFIVRRCDSYINNVAFVVTTTFIIRYLFFVRPEIYELFFQSLLMFK